MYRYFLIQPEWLDELVIKPLLFILPVIIYQYFRNSLNTRTLGLEAKDKKLIVVWGGGFGGFLVLENLIVSLIRHQQFRFDLLQPNSLLLVLGVSIATAFSEEVLYRGFILGQLQKSIQRGWLANSYCALLFSLGHLSVSLFKLHYQGIQLISYLFLVFVLGFANGFIYDRTRSVYASTLAHTLWNFSVSLM